jgi:hypothetical protein
VFTKTAAVLHVTGIRREQDVPAHIRRWRLLAGATSDATHALFDEMPDAHEVFGKMPGAHMMFTNEEGAEIMNYMIMRKSKPRGLGAGTHHSKWKNLEYECLIDSWKTVSLDPITSANQTLGKYYARILDEFNERSHIGDHAKIHMNSNEGAISRRLSVIETW